MDRFDAMRAFARVVEAGSFTKAAQTLHMSKTTVTQLIQQLEARLRVKLLHRTTRRLGVTPDGAVYYERVIRLLADMEDAENSLSSATMTPGTTTGGRAQSARPPAGARATGFSRALP
jgi:DNA-binding transcriptional LysR family regulator